MTPRIISAGINQDGRFELFAIDENGVAYHKWQVFPDLSWTGWDSLGGSDLRACAVEIDALGRLQFVVLGGNGALYIKGQSSPNGNWTDWVGLGGSQLSEPVFGKLQDGSLQVFDVGGNTIFGPHFVYSPGQFGPDGRWSGDWRQLGADLQVKGLTVGNNEDGRLELFALDGNGVAYHKWETGGGWSDWTSLGGANISQLAVCQNQDKRLELFAIGGDRAAYHLWQTTINGNWTGWDGGLGVPYLITNAGRDTHPIAQLAAGIQKFPGLGRMQLFARDTLGYVFQIGQTQHDNGWEQDWGDGGAERVVQLAVVSREEKMAYFTLSPDGSVGGSVGGPWRPL
jgi:hypothetical protein